MDNAQKAIMIGVGLFITIIVIAAVMLITGMGQDLLNSGTQQLSNISSQLESQLTQEYDNKTMTGAQVLSAVKQYYNSTELTVVVKPVKNSDEGYGIVGTLNLDVQTSGTAIDDVIDDTPEAPLNQTSLSEFSDKTNKKYISPTGKFISKLLYVNNDSSNAVIGIVFIRI